MSALIIRPRTQDREPVVEIALDEGEEREDGEEDLGNEGCYYCCEGFGDTRLGGGLVDVKKKSWWGRREMGGGRVERMRGGGGKGRKGRGD